MTDSPTPPDGWYPDPAGGGGLRRWNGTSWTDELRSHDGSDVAPAAPAADEPTRVVHEQQDEGRDAGASAESTSVEPAGVEPAGVEPGGVEPAGEPSIAEPESVEPAAATYGDVHADDEAPHELFGADGLPVHDAAPARHAGAAPDEVPTVDAATIDEPIAAVQPAPAHDPAPVHDAAPEPTPAAPTAPAQADPAAPAQADPAVAASGGASHDALVPSGAPAAAEAPAYPGSPGAPGAPAHPGAPAYPGAPANAGAPVYPGAPADAGASAYPGAPAYPAASAHPGAPAYPAAGATGAFAPHAAPRTDISTNTVWIWLLVFLPLLGVIGLFLFDWSTYLQESVYAEIYGLGPTPDAILVNAVTSVLSIAFYAVTVLFAFLDWRQLRARGVERPFHWAWSFLVIVMSSALVYIIGRAVVARRRTRAGLGPMWVAIAVNVVALVALIGFLTVLIVQLIPLFEALAISNTY